MRDDWLLRVKLLVQISLSAVILGASLMVILSNAYPESHSKWAFGMVGLVIGYWLR